MATDGTMFFGTPHHGIPYSAVQFGTMKDLIYLTDYDWDSQGYYRLTTWISKPTQEGIKIIKSLKKAYKEYQRAESKSVQRGGENDHQYVSLDRTLPDADLSPRYGRRQICNDERRLCADYGQRPALGRAATGL